MLRNFNLLIGKCFIISVLLSAQVWSDTNSIPFECKADCVTIYGKELGISPAGIPSYSNCSAECVIFEPNHHQNVYTGIKWQCVEYARRWLLVEKGVVFGDVDIAADIWRMDNVVHPNNKQSLAFQSFVNGSNIKPQRGDLLIYGKDYLGTGHVAVVVAIDDKNNVLQVAEQNFENSEWKKNYAREISFIEKDNRYWLLDAYLVGWKRVSE